MSDALICKYIIFLLGQEQIHWVQRNNNAKKCEPCNTFITREVYLEVFYCFITVTETGSVHSK